MQPPVCPHCRGLVQGIGPESCQVAVAWTSTCLPYAWGHVGSDGEPTLKGIVMPQEILCAQQTREAVISFGDVSFRENWLLSSVVPFVLRWQAEVEHLA